MAKTRPQKKFTDVEVRCKCAHFRSPSVFFPWSWPPNYEFSWISCSFVPSCEALVRGGDDGRRRVRLLTFTNWRRRPFSSLHSDRSFHGTAGPGIERERERDGKRALRCAVQRGCQREEKKSWCSQSAFTLHRASWNHGAYNYYNYNNYCR